MKDLKIKKAQLSDLVEPVKEEILGKRYELSFSFVSKEEIYKLNKKYRKKDKPTDVLSFSLSKTSGEILICKEVAKLKSKDFGLKPADYLLFLIIHGCLHLKGLDHGPVMEKLEKKYFQLFNPTKTNNLTDL